MSSFILSSSVCFVTVLHAVDTSECLLNIPLLLVFCLSGLLFRNYSRFLQAPKRETLGAIWADFCRPDVLVTQSIVLKHWFIEAVAHRTSSFLDRPTESWRNGCCSLFTSSPVPLLRCVLGNSKCAASSSWSLILMLLVSNYSLHSHRLITINVF